MTFQREDRYIVIKRKDLKKVPVNYRSHLVDPMLSLLGHLPRRECLVIESDWPEYEPAWAMIQARMSRAPQATPGAATHPDDQAEIERLHSEFIAVDEPNNEQVMAFQDASYALGLKRGQAHEAALQQRLNEADQRIDELMRDKHRLDALGDNFWDVRHHSTALADTGDCTSGVDIIGHWMDKPHERVIGENYNENLRAAIDQAMAADAYPPARPEYPELDAALDQLVEDSPEVGS